MRYKFCPECETEKPSTAFRAHKSRPGGLSAYCSICMKERDARRRNDPLYVEKNRERSLAWARAHAEERIAKAKQKRLENAEEHKRRARVLYHANREKILAAQKRRYQANREKIIDSNKRWRKKNLNRYREIVNRAAQKYRSRKAQALATLTARQWDAILGFFENRCAYCGGEAKLLEMEHVTPVSRGGGTVAENIVPACRSCNARKHTSVGGIGTEWIPKPLN